MRMKQGNIFPFEYVLEYDEETPINLTGATVTMTMILDDAEIPTVDKGACVVITPLEGKIHYEWTAGETDVVGMYRIEFVVTFADLSTLSVPSNDVLWMFIMASADGPAVVPP